MLMAYLALVSGLFISAVAIYYSIVGLTSVFAAAAIPIMVMGTSLEVAKLVAASWLKQNWKIAPAALKVYLSVAVVVLMIITSMGIFGFLSKAHSDQSLVSGDVTSKIAVYDEKIKTAKENIDANRKALKQMDEAVDQSMARSTDEKGAEKAVAIRRGQQKERARLLAEITSEQKAISQLSEERAPIAAEVRKVEAEVGPIKYIAAFIYGDNPDANVLEKAVTWVIILIVIVFDPLAITLLLAAQFSFDQLRRKDEPEVEEVTEVKSPVEPEPVIDIPPPIVTNYQVEDADVEDESVLDKHAYLNTGKSFWEKPEGWEEVPPQVYTPEVVEEEEEEYVPPAPIHVSNTDNPIDFPQETKPKKEIEILGDEYLRIDGERYHFNSLGGRDKKVTCAQDLAKKLLETGEYYIITHTPDSVVITDNNGDSTEIEVPDLQRPGDYLTEPTYVQNEEQREGGLWKRIQHPISEQEYIAKSEQNKKGNE